MRRGRALLPHPAPMPDGCGDTLITRPYIAKVTGEHPSAIRRGCTPVAVHVATRCHLYRRRDVQAWLDSRPEKPPAWDDWGR